MYNSIIDFLKHVILSLYSKDHLSYKIRSHSQLKKLQQQFLLLYFGSFSPGKLN